MEQVSGRNSQRCRLGFTLVELLVVIAIIGALAAISTPMLRRARVSSAKSATTSRIQAMTISLENFAGSPTVGFYPPSSMEDTYEVSGNRLDSGIESLVLHLSTQKHGGPFIEWKEDYLANLDEDSINSDEVKSKIDWYFGDNQLREHIDDFGSPLVYIHNNDYGRTFSITESEGEKRGTATAGLSEVTATFFSPTTYQLWSLGPNGENENGAGDDLVAW